MIHPDDTFSIDLDGKPASEGPRLTFRYGTAASWRTYRAKLKALEMDRNEDGLDDAIALVNSLAVERHDLPEDLAEVATVGTVARLALNLPVYAELSEYAQKNSESPQRLPAAESAGTAATSA